MSRVVFAGFMVGFSVVAGLLALLPASVDGESIWLAVFAGVLAGIATATVMTSGK